jgi:8-oxo-dGTP pyrophosphatase MutT (NUDIX family)
VAEGLEEGFEEEAPGVDDLIPAAGGVVWRRNGDGEVEVLLVHRPKYDDWSLPKGKLDPGETWEQAAIREVEEETGLRCRMGGELPSTTYDDRFGRPKVVRYWAMTPESGEFTGEHEVDKIRWLPRPKALDVLSYDRDRTVIEALDVGN